MEEKIIRISNEINVHYLNDMKYKTNFISVFLTVPLNKETVTLNALIPAVLKRGTNRLNNMKDIEVELEEMYGADMNCGLDKLGKNHILKFYIESVKDNFVNENLFEKSILNISELILSPYLEDNTFSQEYVNQEKNNLDIVINDKINDKATYSKLRCIEEMFDNNEYGIFTYGYSEDLKNITASKLYNQYINILETAKIDIFVYTNETEDIVINMINKYFKSEYLNQRENIYLPQDCNVDKKEEVKIIYECLNVNQGKLVLGLNILDRNFNLYDMMVCNAILGVGANSKMFRNVREKEHLAYTASSAYIRNANMLMIYTGIELNNYDKALKVIKLQIEDLKNGNISENEINDAKKTIISSYKALFDEQYKIINYYINQNLSNTNVSIETMIENIEKVQIENVIKVANKLSIDTIYYLKNN